jgi:catechol 2,3-dioxygenase-like lactoylglutathione lyase family enzyme
VWAGAEPGREGAVAIPIQSVMHVNVNCSDLERSLAFYRDIVGLTPAAHTNPLPQKGFPMGAGAEEEPLANAAGPVQWDAWMLQDVRGFAGPSVDLLRWQIPSPVGHPYTDPSHLGFARLGVLVPDIESAHRKASEAGYRCLSPPGQVPVDPDREARLFVVLDPDGIRIELIEQAAMTSPQLMFVDVNCSDHARSLEWYERVLGLEVRGRWGPGSVRGDVNGIEGDVEWEVAYLFPPGQEAFAIDLVQWHRPAPIGRPYANANHLGLYRMAFMVEDIRSCHDELLRQGVECPAPIWLDMGPDIPIDGLFALFFPDPDGTCIELIESPKLG